MEVFKSITIVGMEKPEMFSKKDVLAERNLEINKGNKPIRGGQGNALIGTYGGKTVFNVKILDIAKEVKEKIGTQLAMVQLDSANIIIKIENAKLNYIGNDIIIETDKYTKMEKHN